MKYNLRGTIYEIGIQCRLVKEVTGYRMQVTGTRVLLIRRYCVADHKCSEDGFEIYVYQ